MRKEIFIFALVFLTLTTAVSAASNTLVIDSMEDVSRWSIKTGRETKLSVTEDSSYLKEGSKSLKLEYSGRTKVCDECYGLITFYRKEFSEWKNYEGITFWVYNPDDKIEVDVEVKFVEKTPDDKRSKYHASRFLRAEGWHRIDVPFTDFGWHTKSDVHLPFDLDNFNGFNIRFKSDAPSFTVYIDDLKVYTTLPPTTQPPAITAPPSEIDSDGDGLSDSFENDLGTDPLISDSDADGLSDYQEIKVIGSDPRSRDTDGDGIIDSEDPNPLSPEGEDRSVNWEQIGVILAIIAAAIGWLFTRRKRSRLKRLLDDIDKAYESFKMNSRRCESELIRLRENGLDELKKGNIDQGSYAILEKRIDDYLKEIREWIMDERFGNVPARLKDEVHRMLKDGEISENDYAAFERIIGKSKGVGEKEKSDLKDLVTKWRDEDKIKGSELDKLIGEYMKDIGRLEGTISGIDLKVEINKILKDGIVTSGEYEEFSEMLDRSDLGEEEKEGLKKKLRKIRDLSNK